MDFLKNPFFLLAVYGTAVFFLTLITRRIVESAKPDLKKQADPNAKEVTYKTAAARWWNEVILYSLGPFFGVVLSFSAAQSEYFPDMFKGHWLITAMAGICVGFTCGWFYKVFKKLLSRATNVSEDDLDKKTDLPDVPGGE